MDPAALAEVTRLVRAQIAVKRWHPGAALAVYRRGRLVLDVVAGLADTQRVEPVRPDTLFQLRSAGKPFASVALLQLIERGQLELDQPVAAAWPGFGRHGKERVTVRHILTHRGGFSDRPASLPWAQWRDWDAVVRALEDLPLEFEPGTASAYHHLTQQWVCAELVRRVDGRPFPVYLREEVTAPLGMNDTHVGLPAALARRVAKVHATEGVDDPSIRTLNRIEVQQAPSPVFAVGTARDMARFYAALAAGGSLDGASILRAETLAWALAPAVDGEWDRTLGGPVRRGLGFDLGGLYAPDARACGTESTAGTFYHEGAGTVLCWGDRDLDLAMAYFVNGFRPAKALIRTDADGRAVADVAPDDIGLRRNRLVSDAVREAHRS